MTVRELIAELSKYPPDAELRLETQEGSTSVEKVDCYAGRVVKLFGNGWDDLPEDDDDAIFDQLPALVAFANIHCHEIITAYKCTREDGTDYRTGKVRYVPGEWVTEPNECDDHEPFHVESSDSFDPRSDDTDD